MQSALPAPPAAVTAGSSAELMLSRSSWRDRLAWASRIAYIAFRRRPAFLQALVESPAGLRCNTSGTPDWGFDWLYDRVLVRPFLLVRQRSTRTMSSTPSTAAWLR